MRRRQPRDVEEYLAVIRKHNKLQTVQSHRNALRAVFRFHLENSHTSVEITTGCVAEYIVSNSSEYSDATLLGIAHVLSNYIAYTRGGDPERIKHRICAAIQIHNGETESTTELCPTGSNDEQDSLTDAPSQTKTKKKIVNYLLTYARQCGYGSRTHAMLEVLLTSSCRVGALREIDLSDLNVQQGTVSFQTSVRNAIPPQAYTVSLSKSCTDAVQTYIQHERISLEGDDAAALFTTSRGRVSTTTIRRSVTRACKEALEYHSVKSDDACPDKLREQAASLSPQDLRAYALNHSHE